MNQHLSLLFCLSNFSFVFSTVHLSTINLAYMHSELSVLSEGKRRKGSVLKVLYDLD